MDRWDGRLGWCADRRFVFWNSASQNSKPAWQDLSPVRTPPISRRLRLRPGRPASGLPPRPNQTRPQRIRLGSHRPISLPPANRRAPQSDRPAGGEDPRRQPSRQARRPSDSCLSHGWFHPRRGAQSDGPPTASSDDKLVYGKSELYLKNGCITGWKIDPFANPIRVKLWPDSAVDPTLDFFTIGSTKDDVLVVQGTPTAFSANKYEYAGSVVNFRADQVVSWKSDPGSIPLRARMP